MDETTTMSTKPEMSDEELANKLICILTKEMMDKADMFDYLCWKEEKEQSERVPDIQFLELASDGTACWDKTYMGAVRKAMEHDKEVYEKETNDP